MLKWPDRATFAIRKLFQPLQDIDIYVEDTNDEVFYRSLLKRLVGEDVKIARVFGLGGKIAVLQAAKEYSIRDRKAIFIVDGDFEFVRGDAVDQIPLIYRLDAYCIENLICCEKASTYLLVQELAVEEESAREMLRFDEWIQDITAPLSELFAAYATANKHCPDVRTVSRGVGRLCCTQKRKSCRLSPAKVKAAANEILKAVERECGTRIARDTYNKVLYRVRSLRQPLDGISGKDFVLPLLNFRFMECGCRVTRVSLRMRLAAECDLDRFRDLRAVLVSTAL